MRRRSVAIAWFLCAAGAACSQGDDTAPGAAVGATAAPPSGSSIAATARSTVAAPAPEVTSPSALREPATPDGMVEIPPGIFLMGSPIGEGDPEEHPMHEVIVAGFFLDRTEVTVDAYAACVATGACRASRIDHPFCNTRRGVPGDHPVNCVSFEDADAYCRFADKRLPSEREWEYAASGGAERRRFSWGDEDPDASRACYEHWEGTCKVASFAAGAFGLHDVSGNVWEWTATWYGPYPTESATGGHRVYRGGSWSRRFPKWLRNRVRNRYRTEETSAALGMRCARSRTPALCPEDSALERSQAGAPDVCARVRGTPGCEPGHVWTGTTCHLDGPYAASLLAAPGAAVTAQPVRPPSAPRADAAAATPAAEVAAAPATITRARTPQHDGDCKAHWPSTPAAYRFIGGSDFWSRNPAVAAAGCTKRDMGQTWTSACCAQ